MLTVSVIFQIHTQRERELLLTNPFSIDIGHGTALFVGDAAHTGIRFHPNYFHLTANGHAFVVDLIAQFGPPASTINPIDMLLSAAILWTTMTGQNTHFVRT